jgi:two-component system OmpR family sensor kinase
MVWDIGSTLISNPRLGNLRNRLFWSYLAVIAVILATFSAAIYGLVARDRQHQLNLHLRQVATASAGTLEIIQHEYEERTTDDEYDAYRPNDGEDDSSPITLMQLMGKYEAGAMPTVVANPLTPVNQGVEWFDAQRQLMVREGTLFPQTPLPASLDAEGAWRQEGIIRSFVLPVYSSDLPLQASPTGYVRASESTVHLEAELRRLQAGLALGVVIVSGFATLGGLWLTRQSLKPVLETLTQLKQFTADASHALRNPLTAIRASIAVMQSHPERIHPADAEKLQAIASASDQMSQLVEDLLLLARMDRQTPDQRAWAVIALDELLEDLVTLYGDRADQQQIDLNLELNANADVNGDASQLQRLFTNLIANGLQYTQSGGTVTVRLHRSPSQAVVEVQDTGIGIAAEHLPHLFDRFWRVDQARSYHAGGSGLGLAIAQAVTQHHGGTLTVYSEPGCGSTFTVTLPLAKSR